MSDFTKAISGFRFVQTQYGDTLQSVALRELGDASQWSVIAWFNGLLPPYLTDDASLSTTSVALTGSTIRVPSASAQVDASVRPDDVFLADLQLSNGVLQIVDGDFAVVAGQDNLRQALANRIVTDHGELLFHGDYGANLGRLKGQIAGPVLEMVAQDYVEEAMLQENRVQSIRSVTATIAGDRLNINAEVVPITGIPINVSRLA